MSTRKELNQLRQKLYEERQKYKKAHADYESAMETVGLQSMAINDLKRAIAAIQEAVDALQNQGIFARILAKITK